MIYIYYFFFSSRRRHTRLQGDWSSDVCSSDLPEIEQHAGEPDGLPEQLVLTEEPQTPKEVIPVVLTAPDERQLFCTGVFHVDGDVPEVLGHPPQGDGGGVPEIGRAHV